MSKILLLCLISFTTCADYLVVLPQSPHPIATFAAEELSYHHEKATGRALAITHEPLSEPRAQPVLYLGATHSARDAGIDLASLASEDVVLRTIGNDLYIVGNDAPGDPLSTGTTHAGTLWGVYEILERFLGVRWLWPGSLGEDIPATDTLQIPKLNETVSPRFAHRNLRPGLGPSGFAQAQPWMAFSPEHRERYAKDQTLFLRRHRMGRSAGSLKDQASFGSGHAFESWWERFGADHPEWFQLLPNGKRGPEDPARPDKYTMCVSNPDLHKKIVELWAEERAKNPTAKLNIGVAENDLSAACTCKPCHAWDGPVSDVSTLPPGLERSYEPMQASSRYARFAQAVHNLASQIDPEVRVQMYAYLNYFWAPDPSIKLNKNIHIGFVPWFRGAGWFPRAAAEHEWIKEQWLGWQASGTTLYYRPNWFIDGYTMPLVFAHQFADAFQFYALHEMSGTDFDTLQGQWATQGTNLYLMARLHVRPEAPVETLLNEYYNAFGPAAAEVKEYFTYWENYANENSPRAVESIRSRRGGHFRRYALYALVADELYPLPVFDPAAAILARATEKAAASHQHAARIEFLQQGLQHARACVATAAVINNPDSTSEDRKTALASLVKVRRSLEHTNIANMDRAAIIEADSWKEVPEVGETVSIESE